MIKYENWLMKDIEEKKVSFIGSEILNNNKLNEAYNDCEYCDGSGNDPMNIDYFCPKCGGFGHETNKEYSKSPIKKIHSEKETKEHKTFNVGDVLVLIDNKKSSKMPQEAYEFLMTYKTFTVESINERGKINIGCRISKNEDGKGVEKIYMFSTDRFDLKK